MKLVPLGDQAVLAYCADEASAFRFAAAVRRANPDWLVDVVQAYTSVAVFYDLDRITFRQAAVWVEQVEAEQTSSAAVSGRLHRIPCCYELQLDLARVAEHTHLSPEGIIRLHCETE